MGFFCCLFFWHRFIEQYAYPPNKCNRRPIKNVEVHHPVGKKEMPTIPAKVSVTRYRGARFLPAVKAARSLFSSLTSDGWRGAHGSAPSLHKHGSSMAANSSGSSDREKIAQQRLKIIAGHLQKSEWAISAAECKAPRSNTDGSAEGKTVPRRRYEALNTGGLKESNVFAFSYSSSQT